MQVRDRLLLIGLFLVLSSSICVAQEPGGWQYRSEFVDVGVYLSSGINIIKERSDAILDLAIANVSVIPHDSERQKVLNIDPLPIPTKKGEAYEFTWHQPKTDDLSYSIGARVRVYNTYVKVPKKIGFPIVNLPPEILLFTRPTRNINSEDDDIVLVASKLAEGEDDMYVVVFKMAEWTKENIEYNLSTLTIEASQSASWVLRNEQGVCDELTSLFIALVRSVGIPARFVSGLAYTDSPDFPEKWGGHGWAEVYFPGVGWIPWDVTYGQFGYVDASHINLKESLDSDEPATVYVWQGRGVEAEAKTMKLEGELLHIFGKTKDQLSINVSMQYNSVGLGSYNLVRADVVNLEDSYVSEMIQLAPTENIEIISPRLRNIYLEPKKTKAVFWIIKVNKTLDADYMYTFPILAVTSRNVSSRASFVSIDKESVFTQSQMQRVIDAHEQEKSTTSARLLIRCGADKPYYYGYEDPKIECGVKNVGSIGIEGLRVCLEETCTSASLRINQENVFDYALETLNKGRNPLFLSVENEEVKKSFLFDIIVLDDPKISIKDLSAPTNVTYEKNATIEFLVKRMSSSNPANVTVQVTNGGVYEKWTLAEMESDQRYKLHLKGSTLHAKDNTFTINVTYFDLNGKPYATSKSVSIKLVNLTVWQRIVIFFDDLDNTIRLI